MPDQMEKRNYIQKQPWSCSIKKGALKNFAKFTKKYLCQSLFLFNKVAGLRYRCFPVNFAKILRTPLYRTHRATASIYTSTHF